MLIAHDLATVAHQVPVVQQIGAAERGVKEPALLDECDKAHLRPDTTAAPAAVSIVALPCKNSVKAVRCPRAPALADS
jgi:hypothetical protein